MADQRILHSEEMVGASHATKSDTLNRLALIEHNNDGTHKFLAETELTIASGAITITQLRHKVDTESNAASDDLVTINGGATVNMIILRAEADARTVVIKHGTGNIWLQGKADISLDDLEDGIILFWDSTNSKWFNISGDVTAAANIADNRLVRGNDGAKGVQETTIIVDDSGRMTNPSQPAFSVKPTTTQENLEINGYRTIGFGTEVFDQGNNFAGSTFTAPITGKYQLNLSLLLLNMDSAVTFYVFRINTSNRNYQSYLDASKFSGDLGYYSIMISVLADMDANDTVIIDVYQTDGTAQMDIHTESYFSGALIC